jgi:hypothetical protein
MIWKKECVKAIDSKNRKVTIWLCFYRSECCI